MTVTVKHYSVRTIKMEQSNAPNSIDRSTRQLKITLIASFLFLVVVFAIFSAQTYAYFWDSGVSDNNIIVTGRLDVEFFEVDADNPSGDNDIDPIRFIPGIKVSKPVMIKNTGNLPVYVRIKVEKTILNPSGEMPSGWEDLIICNFNASDDASSPWIYSDGYYYYYTYLEAGCVSATLFDEIYFSEMMGNEFENKDLELRVVCQAVQSNGNSDDPLTAIGWPS